MVDGYADVFRCYSSIFVLILIKAIKTISYRLFYDLIKINIRYRIDLRWVLGYI